MGLSLPS